MHELSYFLPKDQEVRAGGRIYDGYEIPYRGYVWLPQGYAILEVRTEVVHRIAKALNALDQVVLDRLAIPDMHALYGALPPKIEVSTVQPDDPNRSRITVRGVDVDRNRTTRAEIDAGRIRHVEFRLNGRPALLYEGATILLRNNYTPEQGAAVAWEIWRTYVRGHDSPWQRRRRRRR